MKMMIAIFGLVTLGAQLANASLERSAQHVSGFDMISNSPASDCTYFVAQDGLNRNLVVVGVNSQTAPANNTAVKIPAQYFPLREGFQMTDISGHKLTYRNGILKVNRNKKGEGLGREITHLEMSITPDLQFVGRVFIDKSSGVFAKKKISQLSCVF